MARQRSTTIDDRSFSQAVIDSVWQKATVVPGRDANDYRKDRLAL